MVARSSVTRLVVAVVFSALPGCGANGAPGADGGSGGLFGFASGGIGATPAGAGGNVTTNGAGGISSGGAPIGGGGLSGSTSSGGVTTGLDGGVDAGEDGGDTGAVSIAGDASRDGGKDHQDSGQVGAADAGTFTGPCGTFPKICDLTASGPFTTTSSIEGPNCSIYRPTNLGEGGATHPVILWANGTGGPTFVYDVALEYWASHGFIVVAGNSLSGQGSGAEILGCLDYVTTQSHTPGSPLAGKVCPRVGASGHSQGGGGALMAGQDARILVTAPLMPYIAEGFGGFTQACIPKQIGPMLLLSGTNDTIAPPDANQKPVFDGTNVPVFWANLVGGDHVAVSLNGLTSYREQMLAWYRLHLMGDETFRGNFYGANCTLCQDTAWIVQRKGIQ